ncbi:MAG: hypothetical protein M3401_08180, partial [Actinomycetota bacterium]|nr:hypothetical protein [Actinomycetota bacterium]
STAYSSGAPNTDGLAGRPGDTTSPPAPKEGALGRLGGAVDDTTTSLGRSLRSVTGDVGKRLEPLSPALGATVAKTGEALATTVQNLGATVAALLGHVVPGPVPRPGVHGP